MFHEITRNLRACLAVDLGRTGSCAGRLQFAMFNPPKLRGLGPCGFGRGVVIEEQPVVLVAHLPPRRLSRQVKGGISGTWLHLHPHWVRDTAEPRTLSLSLSLSRSDCISTHMPGLGVTRQSHALSLSLSLSRSDCISTHMPGLGVTRQSHALSLSLSLSRSDCISTHMPGLGVTRQSHAPGTSSGGPPCP
jgi:hypothetical protein